VYDNRLKRRTIMTITTVTLALGFGVTAAPAASAVATTTAGAASSTCTVKASLPSRIVINRSTTKVPSTLSGCDGILDSADVSLYGASGVLDSAWWLAGESRTQYLNIYDWDVQPGTYRYIDGGGYANDYHDAIRWAYTSAVIKYGASIVITPNRANGATSIPVSVKRYDPDAYTNNGYVPFTSKLVAIYSATSAKGPWTKVGTVRTNSSGKATLKIRTSAARYYRAATSDSGMVFGTKSAIRRG